MRQVRPAGARTAGLALSAPGRALFHLRRAPGRGGGKECPSLLFLSCRPGTILYFFSQRDRPFLRAPRRTVSLRRQTHARNMRPLNYSSSIWILCKIPDRKPRFNNSFSFFSSSPVHISRFDSISPIFTNKCLPLISDFSVLSSGFPLCL